MSDVRDVLEQVTARPGTPDPVGAVRWRIRQRTRRRRVAGAAAAAAAVATGTAGASLLPNDPEERTSVTASEPPALPSGGAVPASAPADAGTDRGSPLTAIGALVTAHPEAFVGTYLDATGTAVVAFGPDVDVDVWKPRIAEAAGTQRWRATRCGSSRAALERVASDVAAFTWPSGRPALAVDVDPATCGVVVTSGALTDDDKAAATARFGASVTFREGDAARL